MPLTAEERFQKEATERQFRAARPITVDEASRTVKFIASDETVDRYGDIVRIDGWDLSNYLRNPIFAWAHKTGDPPIGQVTSLEVAKKKLVAVAEFAKEGLYPFADMLWKMVLAGMLRAVSVGFLPLASPVYLKNDPENPDRITGLEWTKQELLELSLVPVPANPQALGTKALAGITDAQLREVLLDYDQYRAAEEQRALHLVGKRALTKDALLIEQHRRSLSRL